VSAVARFAVTQRPKASEPAASAADPAAAAATARGGARSSVGDVCPGAGGDGSGDVGAGDRVSGMAAEAPAMSLNFCVTDGRHIVCSRYRNHSRQEPPSLFVLSGAGFVCENEGSCLRLIAPGVYVSRKILAFLRRLCTHEASSNSVGQKLKTYHQVHFCNFCLRLLSKRDCAANLPPRIHMWFLKYM